MQPLNCLKKFNTLLTLFKFSYFVQICSITLLMFAVVFVQERGVKYSQLSLALLISTFAKLFLSTLLGIIADKIGKTKSVLLANMFAFIIIMNILFFMPNVNSNISSNSTNGFLTEPNNTVFVCNSSYLDVPFPQSMNNNIQSENSTFLCSMQPASTTHNENETWTLNTLVFIILFILFDSEFSFAYTFMNVFAMSVASKFNCEYGNIRFWAILGSVIISPLFGYVVKISSSDIGPKNFTSLIIMFDALYLIGVLIILFWIKVDAKPPASNMWRKALGHIKHGDVVVFYIILSVVGISFTANRYYVPMFLNELGASALLLSLVPNVGSLSGLPLLYTSEWWMKKLGPAMLLIIALIAHFLMNLGYYLLQKVWLSLLIETGSSFGFHLYMVVMLRHSNDIAPEGLTSTVISAAITSHFIIGGGLGGLIGGVTIKSVGVRSAFGILSCMNATAALLAGLFFYINKKHKQKNLKEAMEKKSETELNQISSPSSTNREITSAEDFEEKKSQMKF